MKVFALLVLVAITVGCARAVPPPTYHQVYEECMARPYTDPPQYRTLLESLRKEICTTVARDATSPILPYYGGGDVSSWSERQKEIDRFELDLCLSSAILAQQCRREVKEKAPTGHDPVGAFLWLRSFLLPSCYHRALY